MPIRVYTVYLSTQASDAQITPYDETNKASVKFTINWNNIFNGVSGKSAKLKYQLSSLAQNSIYTWSGNSGTARITGLSSQWSNSNSGAILGEIAPIDNPVAGDPSHILYGNTLQEAGTEVIIPSGVSEVCVLILQRDGITLQSNVLDYQLILKFEVEL